MRTQTLLLIAFGTLIWSYLPVSAGVIDGDATIGAQGGLQLFGPGLGQLPPAQWLQIGPGGYETTAPNNDNETQNKPNRFQPDGAFGAFGYIDIVIHVKNSAALGAPPADPTRTPGTPNTSEYRWESIITNKSAVNWTGFRYELGYLTENAFVRSPAGDNLDFDTPDKDPAPYANGMLGATTYATVNHQQDVLEFSNGVVAPNQAMFFDWRFDLPDLTESMNVPDDAKIYELGNPVGYKLTLRLTPIPEPTSGLLLLLGALGGLLRRMPSPAVRRH